MKNEFISNITHELKTPIATVGVAIEALRNFGASQNPEKTKEYLEISAAELQRLGLLVDKVLKLSMFENKTVELKKEMFDMRQLVNEIMQIMKLQFEKCQAKVNVKIVGDNFMIEADRLHITSVLYNLLDNALKYSNENPVIELQLSSLPGNILEIKVRDNGRGIAKEYQSRVFEKFFRVPDFNRHNIKGYGLGLSYVKEIVTSHMGYIVVESESGKGSTFTIKLPMKEMPVIDFGNGRKIYQKANLNCDMSKTKIFYVEDELFLGKIVRESLESRGFEVIMESDGAKATAFFKKSQPDICVLDIMLPNKDGFTIADEIRELNEDVPIIFLTAKTQTEDVVKGFSLGGNDYIRKPFSMEELIVRIQNLLRQ